MKYYSSTPPRDLSRPHTRDKRPGNPAVMAALEAALLRARKLEVGS